MRIFPRAIFLSLLLSSAVNGAFAASPDQNQEIEKIRQQLSDVYKQLQKVESQTKSSHVKTAEQEVYGAIGELEKEVKAGPAAKK